MAREEEIVDAIKSNVAALKFKLERQEAIEKLSEFDMTVERLKVTKAASKLTEVFRSSRFEHMAKDLHGKWIASADREIKERWNEIKHKFLTKDQIAQLDRAQNRYNKKHGLVDPSAIAKKAPVRAENPYQKVYQRFTPSLSLAGPSSSSASSTPLPSPYGAASSAVDPDTNFVAYNYSSVALKRPRGRPRTNFSVKGEGGRKRGRPPTRRT
ncbi:hypothetical protein PMAYCL1PPCAC_03612 [Pristionchus mayeri]|uniref:Uncharacterized protein n=1 Tax=Pristionchus mayeri TaxID=1317129 RepID=A0AAN4Z8U1_9BILA|nr:hypothetical protein PMAYCL1PPCAC_03612 [Pristionchus mayeri]